MPPKRSYVLSEEEKQEYRTLVTDAFEAANNFSGSEETYDKVMSSLIQMENFVRDRNDNKPDEKKEIDFAKQAGALTGQFNTVSGILGHAVNLVYGMLSRISDLKDLLNALRMGGAQINYSDNIYVLTDQAFPSGDGELDRNLQDFRKQPRLAILIKELQTIGIYTDDLVIHVGKVFEDKVRKLPYLVVEIPRLGKQVAICDQYGETTFVSQSILHPYIWASYTKKQLKAREDIKSVPFGMKWPNIICNLLAYGTDDITPTQFRVPEKVDVRKYERNKAYPKFNLTREIILNHALLHLKSQKTWPNQYSGQIETLPDETWGNWFSSMNMGGRGLKTKVALSTILTEFVADEAIKYKDKNGELPTRESGPLEEHSDITWEMIEDAFLARGKAHRTSLEKIYIETDLKEGIKDLSPDIIIDHALAYLEKYKKWPGIKSAGEVEGLTLERWDAWDASLRNGGRSLEGRSSLWHVIRDFIVDEGRRFQEQTGALPHAQSGPLPSRESVSWEMVENALLLRKGRKTYLRRIFIEGGLLEGESKLSEDTVIEHVLLHLKSKKELPSSNSGAIETFLGETWINWNSALFRQQRGLTAGKPLAQFINSFVCTEAEKYQEIHGSLPTRDSGAFGNYDDISWEMLEEAYLKKRSSQSILSLNKVFILNGLKEGSINISDEVITNEIVKFVIQHAYFPTENSGDIEDLPGEYWRTWDTALRYGHRGMPGGISLAQFVADFIRNNAAEYKAEHGELPDKESGSLNDYPDLTWETIDTAITNANKRHNLKGFLAEQEPSTPQTPAVVRAEYLIETSELETEEDSSDIASNLDGPKKYQGRLMARPPLTEETIIEHALKYRDKHGILPKTSSGSVENLENEHWDLWNVALKAGVRGLPGGTTLRKLFIERGLLEAPLPLTEDLILDHAKRHLEKHGSLPTQQSGFVDDLPNEKWANWNAALQSGGRGLLAKSTLTDLYIRAGLLNPKPPLTEAIILEAVDRYIELHGELPTSNSGEVDGFPNENWKNIHSALVGGHRGLQGGSSLHQFLVIHGYKTEKPNLSEAMIIERAIAYQKENGRLPNANSGAIETIEGDSWNLWEASLRTGSRGLEGGLTLRQLFIRKGLIEEIERPDLTEELIMEQIRKYQETHDGRIPNVKSGSVEGLPTETWGTISHCLVRGQRGLEGGSSLTKLAIKYGLVNEKPTLTEEMILEHAKLHLEKYGALPIIDQGGVETLAGETWISWNACLRTGMRGLAGGKSLNALFVEHGLTEKTIRLTEEIILELVRDYIAEHGKPPNAKSGSIPSLPGNDNWLNIDHSLSIGGRGLKGKGQTLHSFLVKHGLKQEKPDLSEDMIIEHALIHFNKHGKLPSADSGPVETLEDETWHNFHSLLSNGGRTLKGDLSLRKLYNAKGLKFGTLTEDQIVDLALKHQAAHGVLPTADSGILDDVPGETWLGIDASLRRGSRGLPGGSSLHQLLIDRNLKSETKPKNPDDGPA